MLNMNLQFFAHKKGVGSTKNGRDSEFRSKESRRTVRKGWKYSLQTAWYKDSSWRKRRYRWRRYFICKG